MEFMDFHPLVQIWKRKHHTNNINNDMIQWYHNVIDHSMSHEKKNAQSILVG